jgi:hypothetical protein
MGGSTDVYNGICFSVECKNGQNDDILSGMKAIFSNIEAGLREHYEAESVSGSGEGVVGVAEFVQHLFNFDASRALQLQQTYNLPDHSPMRYEALQVLEIVKKLREAS